MRTLVAIPVYNEQQYVREILARIRRLMDDVLVVDDGSTDDTPRIVDTVSGIRVIRHERNLGYGQSLISAFGHARCEGYDWIITIDCDDQHEPARIPAFMEAAARGDLDIVSGSRYLVRQPGDTAAPSDRRRINREMTRVLNDRLGLELTDAFCGFKAFRVSSLARLDLTEAGYAFPLQFWVQAARQHLRVGELPVRLIYNDPTRHFGGDLDDPAARLRHYLDVFEKELARDTRPVVSPATTCCGR